ncbi:XisH family protein [Microcoleus sp. FACHB-SPT15]|nr:XisH family protein [Microcoleus sp. FACHB-SPT15]
MAELEPERLLYLAIPSSVFEDLFEEPDREAIAEKSPFEADNL